MAITSVDFLVQLFGIAEQPVFLCSLANEKNDPAEPTERHVATRDCVEADAFISKWDRAKRGVYFCVSTIKANQKRNKDGVAEICFLHADIDFKDVIDDPDTILRRLKTLPLPPSLIVSSGNGYHVYWLFKRSIIVDGQKIIERIETALKLVCDMVGGDMLVTQVAALMRVVGSHNSKRDEWKDVVVVENSGHRYELDDLEEKMLFITSPIVLRKQRPPPLHGEINPFLDAAKSHGFKPPINVEKRLAGMMYMGGGDSAVHTTQLSVSASMLNAGAAIDDVVDTLMRATRAAAGEYGQRWNWKAEESRIRKMCASWVKKRAGEKYESASSGGASSDRHGKSDSSGEPTAPPNSEESLSLTFAKRHEDDLRFVAKWGQWFRWDGTRWVLEETLHAFDLSRAVCREAANACNKAGTSKAIASAKTVAAVERLAKVDRRLVATFRQWDIDADKFNTAEED
jgi:hypothetical protein